MLSDHALTIPLLVKIIVKISNRAMRYAVGTLLSICSVSKKSQREVDCRIVDAVGSKRSNRESEAKGSDVVKVAS